MYSTQYDISEALLALKLKSQWDKSQENLTYHHEQEWNAIG